MPALNQAVTDWQFVVELAIVGDPDRGVLIGQRLRAPFEVDDREASMPQGDVSLDEKSITVGASVRDRGNHSRKDVAVGGNTLTIHEPGDSTHSEGIPTSSSMRGDQPPLSV